MKQFILLLREDIEQMQSLSPKQMEALVKSHMDWANQLQEKGHFVGGDGLAETGKQIVGKACVIKDGPYIESKEMIGGYYLIQAENLEAAVALAKGCPNHIYGGVTEVRPIMDYE